MPHTLIRNRAHASRALFELLIEHFPLPAGFTLKIEDNKLKIFGVYSNLAEAGWAPQEIVAQEPLWANLLGTLRKKISRPVRQGRRHVVRVYYEPVAGDDFQTALLAALPRLPNALPSITQKQLWTRYCLAVQRLYWQQETFLFGEQLNYLDPALRLHFRPGREERLRYRALARQDYAVTVFCCVGAFFIPFMAPFWIGKHVIMYAYEAVRQRSSTAHAIGAGLTTTALFLCLLGLLLGARDAREWFFEAKASMGSFGAQWYDVSCTLASIAGVAGALTSAVSGLYIWSMDGIAVLEKQPKSNGLEHQSASAA